MRFLFSIFVILFWTYQVDANSWDILLADTWSLFESWLVIESVDNQGIEELDIKELDIKESIPDFKIIFQNPSYIIDRELLKESYLCDEEKDECKINFKLVTLEDKDISSKYICEINFWFISWEEDKCNPNTVIFPLWEHNINFKIIDKNDETNFIEKYLIITNSKKEENVVEVPEFLTWSIHSWTWELDNWTWSVFSSSWFLLVDSDIVNTSSWEIISEVENFTWSIFEIPEPFIEVQSWLDYLTGSIYTCKKNACKINLTAVNSFSWIYDESNYLCKRSFSWWAYSTEGTEDKCNPWYVDYSTWSFIVSLKIIDKDDENNFKDASISINNSIFDTSDELLLTWSLSWTGEIIWTWTISISSPAVTSTWELVWSWIIFSNSWAVSFTWEVIDVQIGTSTWRGWSRIEVRDIIVQSWLVNNSCSEEECKVNLKFEKKYKEVCRWDFWEWKYKEKYLNTCNPWIVYYKSWNHWVNLKVFNEDSLVELKYLNFSNTYLSHREKYNVEPVAKITLQWRWAKYKEIFDNKVVCRWVDECSVNFTWDDSFDPNWDNLRFFRDFWNWEVWDMINPKSIKYTPWNYEVSLIVKDSIWLESEDKFYIDVLSKTPELDNLQENNRIFTDIKIDSVLVNPKWRDDLEWVKIKNIWKSELNIKWLFIDDANKKWSKAFYIKDDLIISPHKTLQFYKSYTNISFWNNNDSVNLIYFDKVIDTLNRDFDIPDDFVLNANNLKNHSRKANVLRVVDGDTLLVMFEDWSESKLRLIWIDTPETKHPKKHLEYFWIEASKFTKEFLEWKDIIIEFDMDNYVDKYWRLLWYVYLDDIFFNKYIIEKWYARAYLRFPFKYSKEFEKAQSEAKKQKLWMWWKDEVRKDMLKEIREEKKEIEKIKSEDKKYLFSPKEKVLYENIDKIKIAWKTKISWAISKWFNFWSNIVSWNFTTLKSDIILALEDENKKKINFSQSISYQKKSLKISWKTIANSKIRMSLWWKIIETFSDNQWKYSIKLTDLDVGDYTLISEVVSESWEKYLISRQKEVSLSEDYLQNMQKYYTPKLTKQKSSKKTKKIQIVPSANALAYSKQANIPESTMNFNMLNSLLILLSIIFWVIILRRKRLI